MKRIAELKILNLLLAAAVFAAAGCSHSLTLQERNDAADQSIGWLTDKYGQVGDPQLRPLLRRVTRRLSEAVYRSALETELSGSIAEQFADYPWQVTVLDSSEPNAFSAGAGRIVVTRGLVTLLRSESEFAAIIAHEMSHEILGHNAEALARSVDDEKSEGSRPAPAYSFNPNYEIDADTLGVKILSVARYDTHGALYALTIGYRNGDRSVDQNQDEWARYRTARLKQMVDATGDRQPATVSTREFNKVRWDLGGSSQQ